MVPCIREKHYTDASTIRPDSHFPVYAIADPRSFPLHGGESPPKFQDWHRWAELSLAAATGQAREAADRQLEHAMAGALRDAS